MNDEVELPYDNTGSRGYIQVFARTYWKDFVDVLATAQKTTNQKKNFLLQQLKGKGFLGNLLEEHYFLYKPNSSPRTRFY